MDVIQATEKEILSCFEPSESNRAKSYYNALAEAYPSVERYFKRVSIDPIHEVHEPFTIYTHFREIPPESVSLERYKESVAGQVQCVNVYPHKGTVYFPYYDMFEHDVTIPITTNPENVVLLLLPFSNNNSYIFGYFNKALNSMCIPNLLSRDKGIDYAWRVVYWLRKHELLQGIPEDVPEEPVQWVFPIEDITYGADPEFEICRNCQPFDPRNEDYERIRYDTSGPVGLDGNGNSVELRPAPAKTPEDLVENLSTLFETITDVHLSTIGDHYPIGGHIHFGFGKIMNPSQQLLTLLDYFIGKPTIDLSGSRRGHYSSLSSYETKQYGFEYRTPPAAIFENPEIFRVVLALSKALLEKYMTYQEICLTDNVFDAILANDLLSEEDTALYHNFIKDFKSTSNYSINTVAYWSKNARHNPPEELPQGVLQINMADEWDPSTHQYIYSYLSRNIKLKPGKNVELILYGLASTRGLVIAGPSLCNFESTEHSKLFEDLGARRSSIRWGIPYCLRKEFSLEKLEEIGFAEGLLAAILDKIQPLGYIE